MDRAFRLVHLGDVAALRAGGAGLWHPLRRELGITAFGINAYSAEHAGEPLIERHDERSPGSGGHEELYLVVHGGAAFQIADERVEAGPGAMVVVAPGTERSATALEDDTMVLVVGGRAGGALPVSPYEYWYAAEPHSAAGDQQRAIEIASEGLEEWPDHPMLHYQLACYHALGGDRDGAVAHLRVAYDNDPSTREWAADDDDLATVRDDPALR